MVTETDTGHEGPERPRGPTGGPLAATDGERRVGRALPRHGHALPTEPAILEFSNSTPLFQLRSSEVLGANVAPRTHGGRRLPGRPPGECAPRSTEAGADAAPRQGARPRATTSQKGCPRSPEAVLAYACCAGLAPTKSRAVLHALFYDGPPKHGGRAVPRPPVQKTFSGSLWPSGAPGNNPAAKSERVIFVE